MLVLSRKCGEEIVIPQPQIRITVLDVRGGRVRLGITAPGDIDVFRQELCDRLAGDRARVRKRGRDRPAR